MSIENLRTGIDEIDSEIIRLLNRRCELARQIGAWKHENNLPIYVPEREQQLLDRLADHNPGPLDRDSLIAIYREIMSAAIKLEQPMNIAFLGPEGTFSHQAVLEKFGRGVTCQPVPTIADVFNENGYHTAYFGKWHLDGFHEREGRAALHTVHGPARAARPLPAVGGV